MEKGNVIRIMRLKVGMTQQELADKLGISYVGISAWETGARNPKYETLVKIADALGVPIEELTSTEIAENESEGERDAKKRMENKQEICNLLLAALQATYNAADLLSLDYDTKKEVVTATFEGGGKRIINVAMDSGTAMIRDIMKHLGC